MLAPSFDAIDLDVSGGITFAEMRNALGGLATDSQLGRVIAVLDSNNDGQLTKLELIKGGTDHLSEVKSGTDNLTQLSDVVGSGSTGLAGVNAELDGVAKDATLSDEAKGAKWSKNTAKAVAEVGKGIVPWMPEFGVRLYEISRFTAKGKDKPLNSYGRTEYWKNEKSIDRPGYSQGFAAGGVIPGYADGGVIGNGVYNRDSVLARYADGGAVMLAGGEGVINANATRMIGPSAIDLINSTGRLPGGDNGRHFTALAASIAANFRDLMRVEMAATRAVIEGSREGSEMIAQRLDNVERRLRINDSREPRRRSRLA
ncbi:EF-hand domain-containing protein [Bauldia litoralis]|uniref:EF-hand domain-containing protein n=1 Tax=Bauldia litoralis TaxID=665467 RepID=UPI0032672C46